MTRSDALLILKKDLEVLDDLDIHDEPDDLARYSLDAFDYSPVLSPRLKNCKAQLVARPRSIDAVEHLASACARHAVPITVRGAGTGNYGQCVPLDGGVVMLTNKLRCIREINDSTGIVTVEPGCPMGHLDQELRSHSRQLRLLPSTWRSATIGGFVAGGSGGIGSVSWGFLRDPGHLLGCEVVPVTTKPQRLYLENAEAEALNHAYGTNGIITALTLATIPSVDWQQVSLDCADWNVAVKLLLDCGRSALSLHLATALEAPLLKKLPAWSGPTSTKHRLLLLVAPDGLSTLYRLAAAAGADLHSLGAEDLKKSSGLRELSWNHTTCHTRASEPGWTYLQMLLPQPELPAMHALQKLWGDDLIWHLELVRQQGDVRIAALPLVRWHGAKLLKQLIADCHTQGAIVFNPHVITVEDGGLGIIDGNQVATKQRLDPNGLMNPGKLRGWLELNQGA
ncbi:FAD-binding oxidoreductase [Synechococcus sp. M16CYN]|uniref:FAD-binding oxidoreductase n=1 Tax=Synechococcus sp. M16CYN TaxID=3103139 RepID=UPI003251555C